MSKRTRIAQIEDEIIKRQGLESDGKFMSSKQIAKELGVHYGSVRNAISKGELGFRTWKIQGRRVTTVNELARYFVRQERECK